MRVNFWVALGVSLPLCAIGEARTDIDQEGKVFVPGELWNAHTCSRVGMRDPIVVRRVEGPELEVEKK